MAYTELIKTFSRIRRYLLEFYVYGFKSREEYNRRSSRSYDDERRRLESLLSDNIRCRRTVESKTVYISVDSRTGEHNPFFRVLKAKSFTDGDITLHFILFDILSSPDISLSLSEITELIDERLSGFELPRTFDLSTVRKKLNEYCREGIIIGEKRGRSIYYRRSEDIPPCDRDMLDLFTEIVPCGVIGSFLLDRTEKRDSIFRFKHHYLNGAIDSEIMYGIFDAIGNKCFADIVTESRRYNENGSILVPLKLMISTQSGRQYLMAYDPLSRRIKPIRTDRIQSIKTVQPCPEYDRYRSLLDRMQEHIWGISTESVSSARMEHIDFTVFFYADELHILRRLEREKRCGTVEQLTENTARFSADVYNVTELIPWVRTFICRITEIHISDKAAEKRFLDDIQTMYRMYSAAEERHDIQ